MTQAQKKIIFIALIIAIASLGLWFIIYLPAKTTLRQTQDEFLKAEGQIKEIEEILRRANTSVEAMKLLKEKYRRLDNKLSSRQEEAMKILSEPARRLNVEVISVSPRPQGVFVDKENQKISLEGKTCKVVPVSMGIRCFYKDLVKYIEALNQAAPVFITVEKILIKRDGPLTPRLDINLELNLYYLS